MTEDKRQQALELLGKVEAALGMNRALLVFKVALLALLTWRLVAAELVPDVRWWAAFVVWLIADRLTSRLQNRIEALFAEIETLKKGPQP